MDAKRAYFHYATWRKDLQVPPNLDLTIYGWSRDVDTKSLQLVMLHLSSHQLQIISSNFFTADALQKLYVTQVKLMWLCGS